ncbi:MAG: hypothetical protein ACE5GS_15145 [Kiloniellaceae bacterium]
MEATERLWLTADGTKLVREGDPRATTLYAVPGDEIPERAAAQFGLVDGRLKRRAPAADKQRGRAEDKAVKPAADKGGLTIKKGWRG